MVQELKMYEGYFRAIIDGRKTFEVRKDVDRGIQADDLLLLKEIRGTTRVETGRSALVQVVYVYSGPGMENNYVALGIKMVEVGGM